MKYFGAAVFAVVSFVAGVQPASASVVDDARSDADWIMQAQLSDGAIAHHVDKAAIWPYLSSFAAIGLTRAADVTGNRSYADAAWSWTSWYAAHMDVNGYVTDYRVSGTVETSTGDMDSTDSYAAMYLLAVRNAWISTGDRTKLEAARAGIAKALSAMESTLGADGLTWAKPSWHVKYLMDNAEVYGGLRAAAELARALGDVTLEDRATARANTVKQAVNGLWNASTSSYDWAVHENGARQATNWKVFYPDAAQQMWAVAFGLVEPSRAAALVARFEQEHPAWDLPTATALYDSGAKPVGYWAPIGWAYQRVGNSTRAATAALNIRSAALAVNRAWPFTPSDAGQLIVLGNPGRSILAPDQLPARVTQVTTTTTAPKTTTTTIRKTTTTTIKKTTTTTTRKTLFSAFRRTSASKPGSTELLSRHSSAGEVARFALALAIPLVVVGSRVPRRLSRARR